MAEVVHGTYRTETVAGYVADFCPVCRQVEGFKLMRVGEASHVVFLSLGNGRFGGYLIRCGRCGTGWAFDEKRYSGMTAEMFELTIRSL